MEKSGNIVFTFDNILFDTDYALYLLLMENKMFTNYIPVQPLKTLVEFNNRKSSDFISDLLFEKYKYNDTVKTEIFLKLYAYARKNNIYKGNTPSKLAQGTLTNPYYIDNTEIKHIYIIVPESRKEQITEYIRSFCINMQKVSFIFQKPKQQLHEVLENINWYLLVCNNPKEVKYIAEKFNIDGKEFLMPKTPYINIERKVKLLITEKGGHINYYVPEE